jgi:hypothetical protein
MLRIALFLLFVSAMTATAASIEGPVTGGNGIFVQGTAFDPADVGYVEDEYFLSGTATAYTSPTPLGGNGQWTATPGATAPFKTRVVVFRPAKKAKFNGTVVVEWLNVSGGVEAAADWIGMHTELTREGYGYVAVSAQFVGVEGGPPLIPGIANLPLKGVDPVRYGSLSHPGDSFSYDIYSQAGQAVSSIFKDVKVKRVIAVGESQSAFRMVTYVNAVHPLAGVYDAFLIHSRSSSGAALAEAPQAAIQPPSAVTIRTDIDVPVLTFQTETDLTFLNSVPSRQPDTDKIRLWEVAGTAHADSYTVSVGMTDTGTVAGAELAIVTSPIPGQTCPFPINGGPQHFVLKGAIHALDRWARSGKPPASMPRLEVNPGSPVTLPRDENGNVLGGIRTPQLDVPIAAFSGGGQTGSIICLLLGTTAPFDQAKLQSLYGSSKGYVKAFNKATRDATRSGVIRPQDAKLMKAAAKLVDVGS